MKIKYSPCGWNPYAAHNFPDGTKPDTEIKVRNENTIEIDGKVFEFDTGSVQWPNISQQTEDRIIEARRESGWLYLTVRRFYTRSCSGWDTGDYHDVQPEVSI